MAFRYVIISMFALKQFIFLMSQSFGLAVHSFEDKWLIPLSAQLLFSAQNEMKQALSHQRLLFNKRINFKQPSMKQTHGNYGELYMDPLQGSVMKVKYLL